MDVGRFADIGVCGIQKERPKGNEIMWIQDPIEGIDNVEIELRWHDEGADEEYWDSLMQDEPEADDVE